MPFFLLDQIQDEDKWKARAEFKAFKLLAGQTFLQGLKKGTSFLFTERLSVDCRLREEPYFCILLIL